MMRTALVVFIAFLLSACGVPAYPVDLTAEVVALNPITTPTIPPTLTSTPTETPPTASPVPTVDPNYFRDDFTEVLDRSWTWLREDPANWSLTDQAGLLKINVSEGYTAAHDNRNLLLRPAPSGNFQIETRFRFWPADNFQFAGLIIYQSDSNFVQAGREFCSAVGCIGEGMYMDTYRKGVIVKPGVGYPYTDTQNKPISIRLTRRGETYTFEASTDAQVWFFVGSQTSDMNPLQIGLVTGQRVSGELRPARFDYFIARSLP